jgi:serine/threonine-protein kinase RsbT
LSMCRETIGMSPELVVEIRGEAGVLLARRKARELARPLSFSQGALAEIATAVSEVARNIVIHAARGAVGLRLVGRGARRGLMVIARDEGPGIADVDRAMEDGYSTASSLGLGLPGSKRLMDEFEIVSAPGKGTAVTMIKWES